MDGGRRFGALQMYDYIISLKIISHHHNYKLKKLLDVWSMAGHSGDYTLNVTTIIIIVYTAKLQQPPPRLPIFVVFDIESRSFLSSG